MKKTQPKPKKKSTASINANKIIASQIPYIHCFTEAGMIETEPGRYSVCYEIFTPDSVGNERYMSTIAHNKLENILITLKDFTYSFTIRNSVMAKDEYMEKICLSPNKSESVNAVINDYNQMISDNIDIGHNNYCMRLYLTIVKEAKVADDALKAFEDIDESIVQGFKDLYGYNAVRMDLAGRLESLYDIYHPDENAPRYDEKVDYDGNGFSVASMKRMKLNTKDIVAPLFFEAKERNYLRVGNKFVRMFFVNSIPAEVADSLLPDLISISSNSILSAVYTPMDSFFGYDAAARLVKDNIEVKSVAVRDNIEDRKSHRMERKEILKEEDEYQYFNRAALETLTECKAKDQPVVLATFIIGLFSDDEDELNRDTALLKMSAGKYAVQIRCFDYQQKEAFQSVLPLGNMFVDATRTFKISRLSSLLPVNITELFEKKVTLQGLNGINDNFILVDRSNYPIGLISGVSTSGKTFSLKRDIVNTLMSTDDTVIVLTSKPNEYDNLLTQFDGEKFKATLTDLYSTDPDYGLTGTREEFKKSFLEAFMVLRTGIHKKRVTLSELEAGYEEIRKEAEKLAAFDDYVKAYEYANADSSSFRAYLKALSDYVPASEYPSFTKRFNVSECNTPSDILVELDYLWNMAIAMKKMNKNLWIYIDGIDELIYSELSSDYLISLLDKCNKLKIPVTMTIQDAARICSHSSASIEMDYLLEKIGYFKLLSQGVIERKKYVEKLGISQALVSYIADREPGEGIIITPSISISFNDRFENKDNPFYHLFY